LFVEECLQLRVPRLIHFLFPLRSEVDRVMSATSRCSCVAEFSEDAEGSQRKARKNRNRSTAAYSA
jgi:hypothetical protein